MKFPGRRKSKHYFPVSEVGRESLEFDFQQRSDSIYITGICQIIVDIEAQVTDEYLARYELAKGESVVLDDKIADRIYFELKGLGQIVGEYPGGAIGNTLHNYSVLSDSRSVLLGTMSENIRIGDYAYNYISKTSYHVDLSNLRPVDGPMGRAMCLVTPDGDRTFAISKGVMNEFTPEHVNEDLIKNSSALLLTAFLLRDETAPMFAATMKAAKLANHYNVPVVMSLGTAQLVRDKKDFLRSFIQDHCQVVAMNQKEAQALVDLDDPLLAAEKILDLTDMALVTVGDRGLYLCGHCDESSLRETKDMIHSKSIAEYNKFEYSRVMRKRDCAHPVKIYTHINPFMGGPKIIANTNGAGDAALAAILHDMTANSYHRQFVPTSPKHEAIFLTYSSIHQMSKYANRASYEVLRQSSPRLIYGLPEREANLEDGYWAQ
jgi:inosine kinase